MNALTGFLGHVPGPVAYVTLAAAVLAESVLLVGAFIPTLSLLLASGALARAGDLNLALVIVTAAARSWQETHWGTAPDGSSAAACASGASDGTSRLPHGIAPMRSWPGVEGKPSSWPVSSL
ncbi:hypothetical protein ACFWR4_13550 [Streptomyces hydrogenans]|uniref:hypothetical protein n=1 Tax=Streptomyces hydrogenans TaxID=1873719 RepID=UPI0036625AD0